MTIRRRQTTWTSTMLAACALLFASSAFGQAAPVPGRPEGFIDEYPHPIPKTWRSEVPESSMGKPGSGAGSRIGQLDAANKGATAMLDKAGKGVDVVSKALDLSKSLNASDDRLKPNYQPAGAPSVPSKCLEDAECEPCYTEAYGKVNKTRIALEKVRAHYDFTHKFSADGVALMNAVAGAAGGPAGIGAAVESRRVNESVKAFDTVVARKNAELLGRLEDELMEVSACEAEFYENDDWYQRFGYMYYQFMTAHYGYATEH